jgi:hypothetical protein
MCSKHTHNAQRTTHCGGSYALSRTTTSCAIRGVRGRGFGHRSPFAPWVQRQGGSWDGLGVVRCWDGLNAVLVACGPGGQTWPLGRWVRCPVIPTGDRHRRWPLWGPGGKPRRMGSHGVGMGLALSTGLAWGWHGVDMGLAWGWHWHGAAWGWHGVGMVLAWGWHGVCQLIAYCNRLISLLAID